MYSGKQIWFFSFAILSLFANGYLGLQLQLHREKIEGAAYLVDISTGKNKIKGGMSFEDVIARVHHEPDETKTLDDGSKICSWSAYYHYGYLEKLLGRVYANGHYWLNVYFDVEGKVVRVELTEA